MEADFLGRSGATDASFEKTLFDSMHSSRRLFVKNIEELKASIDICDWPPQVLGINQIWLRAEDDAACFSVNGYRKFFDG